MVRYKTFIYNCDEDFSEDPYGLLITALYYECNLQANGWEILNTTQTDTIIYILAKIDETKPETILLKQELELDTYYNKLTITEKIEYNKNRIKQIEYK